MSYKHGRMFLILMMVVVFVIISYKFQLPAIFNIGLGMLGMMIWDYTDYIKRDK